jgi:16S rRNA (cytosine1402-N4)-methyltransferase
MKDQSTKTHEPVMVQEVLEGLKLAHLNEKLSKGKVIIDATVGLGGHSIEIIKRGGFVVGIDADGDILKLADERMRSACPTPQDTGGCYQLFHGNFTKIDEFAKSIGIHKFNGILFDLGVNSPQITSPQRGFSFENPDAELDMRINKHEQAVTAADLLNVLDEKKLNELFGKVMSFAESRRLSANVVRVRKDKKFTKVGDLLSILGKGKKRGVIHPATLPFMALRMAVNTELENLNEALPKALNLLDKKGRLVVISFHSGEDAVVKNFFKSNKKISRIITKKPLRPGAIEIGKNPRARSSKLRILEKL